MIDLSIDPGKHGCGLAMWQKATLLEACYVPEHKDGKHALLAASLGVTLLVNAKMLQGMSIDVVTIERPKHYPTAQQKGDQEDISELSIVVGALAQALAPLAMGNVRLVYPHEWKGQAPKEVTKRRVLETLAREELARIVLPKQKELQHNCWDAVGIGLSRMRRG